MDSDLTTVTPGGAPPPPPSAASAEFEAVRAALEADYEVLEELGRGGMAVVYRARERELDREVAIKVLPSAMTFDTGFVERFQREARTAGALEHPNIVPIYRVGRSGHVIYFVMKLLRGQSLAQILRERGKLAVSEVRHILLDVASALGYAAKRNVVHRDIKPDNILLDQEGRCIVSDFGIAKTPQGPRTQAGTSMGTPRYMSPEHAQGIPLDGRSDIYSLGVVAYQCLVGTTPFDGEDPFAVLYKHINAPLPQPAFESEEERDIFRVIERMLAKKPEQRFQTADELISALGGEVTGGTTLVGVVPAGSVANAPTQIMATGPLARLMRMMPRGRRLWIDAAGLAVIAVLAYLAIPRDSETPAAATAAVTPSGTAKPDSARPITAGRQDTATPPPTVAVAPAVVTAKKPAAPPPEPFSRCPRLQGAAATRASAFKLLVDSVRNQKPGSKLTVNYDVCGLPGGTAYTLALEVRRTSGPKLGIFGRVAPVTKQFVASAQRPRSRASQTIDLATLPPGEYWLQSSITDQRENHRQGPRKTFKILEK
jgi:hypothetical protein